MGYHLSKTIAGTTHATHLRAVLMVNLNDPKMHFPIHLNLLYYSSSRVHVVYSTQDLCQGDCLKE